MKPVKKNVLVRPGKDRLADGPESAWIEELEANLNLILKKYAAEPLISLKQGDGTIYRCLTNGCLISMLTVDLAYCKLIASI